jgi:hypothetical protein
MKKLLIGAVLLATGFIVSSGLFAQDLRFDGYVNSGLGVVASSEDEAPDPFLAAYGTDSWNSAFRIRLNARYASETGNVGAHLQLQASSGYNFLTFPIAYGWFSAFNNILTVKGGIVDDGVWNTGGTYFPLDIGEGLGILAKVTPITGLDLGVGAYVATVPLEFQGNGAIDDNNSSLVDSSGVSLFGINYYAKKLEDAKYTFNAAYTLPDLLKIIASYRTKSLTGAGEAPNQVSSEARLSLSLLAIPNLKAVVELDLDNLQDFETMETGDKDAWDRTVGSLPRPDRPAGPNSLAASGKISIGETLQYNLGNLTVGLWAVEWFSLGKKTATEDADVACYVNPWASYAFGAIVPRLDIGFGGGVQAAFNNASGLGWRRGALNVKYDSDYSIISFRPSVKLNIDPNTFVEIGDLIDIDGAPDNTWGTDSSRVSNVFYIDLKWSF